MYMGDEAFIEVLDRLFDSDSIKELQKMTFAQVRTMTGMINLVVNSRAFNQAKRALLLWSKQVCGKNPVKAKGTRPAIWYYMPPLRDGPDPEPPDEEDEEEEDDESDDLVFFVRLLLRACCGVGEGVCFVRLLLLAPCGVGEEVFCCLGLVGEEDFSTSFFFLLFFFRNSNSNSAF